MFSFQYHVGEQLGRFNLGSFKFSGMVCCESLDSVLNRTVTSNLIQAGNNLPPKEQRNSTEVAQIVIPSLNDWY